MDVKDFLGIDDGNALDRLADYIVSADERLIRDLVARRAELGLTQQDVADRMGIHKSNVSRIERGDGDLLQSTLRRYVMALDAVVVHEVCAFEDVDGAHRAREYFAGRSSSYPVVGETRRSVPAVGEPALVYG